MFSDSYVVSLSRARSRSLHCPKFGVPFMLVIFHPRDPRPPLQPTPHLIDWQPHRDSSSWACRPFSGVCVKHYHIPRAADAAPLHLLSGLRVDPQGSDGVQVDVYAKETTEGWEEGTLSWKDPQGGSNSGQSTWQLLSSRAKWTSVSSLSSSNSRGVSSM